jgi:hypothetical protein
LQSKGSIKESKFVTLVPNGLKIEIMSYRAKKRRPKYPPNAAERLFLAAFGRKMTAKERRRFIVEKPVTLEEIANREKYAESYDFLRQT